LLRTRKVRIYPDWKKRELPREVLSMDVKFAHNDILIAVIVKDETGQELAKIRAKDILPEY